MKKSQTLVAVVVVAMVMMFLLIEVSCGNRQVLKGSKAINLCNMSEDDLKLCKPSVTKPNPVDPTVACCAALSKADLTCLCSYKNSMVLPMYGIDPDLAMQLPAKCSLTPPTTC